MPSRAWQQKPLFNGAIHLFKYVQSCGCNKLNDMKPSLDYPGWPVYLITGWFLPPLGTPTDETWCFANGAHQIGAAKRRDFIMVVMSCVVKGNGNVSGRKRWRSDILNLKAVFASIPISIKIWYSWCHQFFTVKVIFPLHTDWHYENKTITTSSHLYDRIHWDGPLLIYTDLHYVEKAPMTVAMQRQLLAPYLKEKPHNDVIKWKHFPCYWSFVRGIHRSPVNSPHKDQWRGALMFSLIIAWIKVWVNNRETSDLGHHHAHYDVTVLNYINALCNDGYH